MRRKRGCIYVCALKKKKEKKSVGGRSQAPCEIKQSQKKGDGEDFEIRVQDVVVRERGENGKRRSRFVGKISGKKTPPKKGLSPRLHAKLTLVQTAVRTSKPTRYQVKMSF